MIPRPFPLSVDVHVHLAALPDGLNGCRLSPRMRRGWATRLVAARMGLDLDRPFEANQRFRSDLLARLRASRFVRRAVLLAMDGVYGEDGRLDVDATHFLIPNDLVLGLVREHGDCLLAGVSINPARRDAVEELHRCADLGAALVKVLPNAQSFNPADDRYRTFYRALAERKLPLLSHVGYEFSLVGRDQSVGDPARLRLALEEGVTVIAAHGASQGLFVWEKHWGTLVELVRRHPNFFWDASALSLPNRVGMLLRLARRPDLQERMLFGTDYPLPTHAYPALLAARGRRYLELRREKNPFDRHYRLLEALGFPLPTTDREP